MADAGVVGAVRREIVRRYLAVAGPAAALICVYYGLWGPVTDVTRVEAIVGNLALLVTFSVVLAPVAWWWLTRRLRGAGGWADEGRGPSDGERATLFSLSRDASRSTALTLFVVAAVTAMLNYANIREPGTAAQVGVGLGLAGVLLGALGYLTVERALRPLFARALASRPMELDPAAVGVRRRLVLAWALGSGVPILFLAAIPLGLTGKGKDLALPWQVPLLMMSALGLLAGLVSTLAVGASIADPLEGIRAAMRRVREGELDVGLSVDDAGEVGLLQQGFNEMVAGLREREQLHDLFGRHVGAEVAQRALSTGVELGGEDREVSVLFVDLIGSTALAEQRTATEVVAVLNRFFDAVVRQTTAEGGWVNKFEGDGALCVFGAPVAQPDHAACALRAARNLHVALAEQGLDAGIGVSSGQVVAGNVGAEHRFEYTVIGRPVNEAARLTDAAKREDRRVLASAVTVAAAGAEAVHWLDGGVLELRGVSGPVAVAAPAARA